MNRLSLMLGACVAAGTLVACHSKEAADDGGIDGSGASNDLANCGPSSTPPSATCDSSGGSCPELTFAGDGPGSAPTWHGDADPTIYHDPTTPHRMWVVRSSEVLGTRPGAAQPDLALVEVHLARSDDDGHSWTGLGPLFPLTMKTAAGGQGTSYVSTEVGAITASTDGGKVVWYASHISYFAQPMPGYHPLFSSFVIHVARQEGGTPQDLASAPEQILTGTSADTSDWGATVDLNHLDPSVSACQIWNNPALIVDHGTLYLTVECQVYAQGGKLQAPVSPVAVFATDATKQPAQWSWRFVGMLADAHLAADLGVARLGEPEVTRAADGSLLALLTPYSGPSLLGNGCLAIELATLEPPTVRRDCTGKPVVRAIETGPSTSTANTSACSYDAAAIGAGILTVELDESHGFLASVHATGLRP